MTDRELLELAARAAGKTIDQETLGKYQDDFGGMVVADGEHWNPLIDECTALLLAVRLRMCIDIRSEHTEVTPPGDSRPESEEHENDPCAATRRAIVRAAAEVGRRMIEEGKDGGQARRIFLSGFERI